MSYCRFSEGDVYAYACEGGVQFWVAGEKLDRLCNTYNSAYQYAKYLRDECGLDVPSHAIEALRADAIDESNHGDGSVVAEIVSENAKLREQGARLFDKTLELGTENAKLRELIRTVWLAGDFRAFLGVDEIKEQMRELGIEVKDD